MSDLFWLLISQSMSSAFRDIELDARLQQMEGRQSAPAPKRVDYAPMAPLDPETEYETNEGYCIVRRRRPGR